MVKKEREEETKTIGKMIEIYCHGLHQTKQGLCEECEDLLLYAKERLRKCPHKIKPKCSDCKIHCYEINKRNRIKEVMKYSGPRMLIKHPILAVKHFKK
jgi:hypothetical protein